MFEDLSEHLPPLPFWMRMVQAGDHENLQYAFGGDRDVALVDPTWELDRFVALVEAAGRTPSMALFTHGHWDHIGGAPWCAQNGIQVVVHEAAREHPKVLEARDGSGGDAAVRFVGDGDTLDVDGVRVEVLATPGHQPDAVCFLARAKEGARALCTGDTLFIGSCGRTDFPGGDTDRMYSSMERLRSLPADVHVMPGHHYASEPTRPLPAEIRENPALSTIDRVAFDALPCLRG